MTTSNTRRLTKRLLATTAMAAAAVMLIAAAPARADNDRNYGDSWYGQGNSYGYQHDDGGRNQRWPYHYDDYRRPRANY